MARILITTIPIEGHVRPCIPIAKVLADQGHDVTWYTGTKFQSLVTGTGARFTPVNANVDHKDGDVLRDMERGKQGLSGLKKTMIEVFIAPVLQYVSDVTAVVDDFDPDVIIADHVFLAAPMVAAKRGIPSVLFSVGPLGLSSIDTAPFGMGLKPSSSRGGRLRNRALNLLVENVLFRGPQQLAETLMRDWGGDSTPGFLLDWGVQLADRYLQASIPEFEYPRSDLPETVEFVGAMLPPRPADWSEAAWWPELTEARRAGRPVVLVTQGTANPNLSELLLPAIAALADQDMLVIATTAGPDPDELIPPGQRPANLRLEKFVPFTELLPLADLLVTNGGFGGTQMSLANGVPIVAAGADDDKMEICARIVWAGAGLYLRTQHPSVAKIRRAVHTVLTEPSYQTNARRLKEDYARYSGGARAAEVVLEVARGPRKARSWTPAEDSRPVEASHRPEV